MKRLVDYWVNHPVTDYLLVLLAVVVVAALESNEVPAAEDRAAWYQALASLSGALLAVGGVAVTIVFAVTPSRRLERVYESTGPRLADLVISCLAGLALTTAGFVALFLVPPTASDVRNAMTASLVVLAGLRIARLWWLFRRVLRALMTSDQDNTDDDRTEQTGWTPPTIREADYSLKGKRARRRRTTSTIARGGSPPRQLS